MLGLQDSTTHLDLYVGPHHLVRFIEAAADVLARAECRGWSGVDQEI